MQDFSRRSGSDLNLRSRFPRFFPWQRIQSNSGFVRPVIIILTLVLLALVLWFFYSFISKARGEQTSPVTTLGLSKEGKIEVKPAKASQDINQLIEIPLENDFTPLQMEIQKAELRDEVIIQGKRANTVTGRTFLILTLKISNANNTSLSINTRNFIRLSVNGNENEWLAPEIHNDPVEVQAMSTKYTRLGFALNETDTALVLRAGKLEGEKLTIPLDQMK